ncbi:hypothetical protein Daus18300_007875 [Diaporthe australafricana]|uniref:Major facilitator superfamily (MFS) profile domain-containing protein n=1 Tax=Diaporthe australafricana TaxID=127596 RepID=A0ABR3WKL2_9PEZI
MAGAEEHSDSGSHDGAVTDHHTTSSTTETITEKHHELAHDDSDREKKIEAALAEGHDADTPSGLGYLLDDRGELKRQRSIAEQTSLALAKSRSNASHQNGTSDLEKGVTPEDKDAQAVTAEGESDPNIVWWDGPDDPENPMNWPSWRKVLTCTIISFLTFVTPLASSIFAPGVPDLMADFKSDSNLLASFVVSVYVLGFAFGPLIMDLSAFKQLKLSKRIESELKRENKVLTKLLAPMSELYGRSIVYHVSNVGFVAFLIGCALAPDLNSLVVFRFFCGCFGASPLTNGGGSIADIIRQEKRGSAMAAFSVGPLLGPIIGPVAGGFLTEAKGWRWVFWVLAMVAGVVTVLMIVLMKETYAPVILQRKTVKLRKETGNEMLRSKLDVGLSPRDHFYRSIIRPLKMLIRSPIVALFAAYIAVVYGYLYLMFTSMSEVFQKTYHFSTSITGLVFLGMGVGSMAGLAYFSATSDRYIQKMAKIEGKGMKPEYRLRQLPVGAFLLPGGFFLYGWTAQYHVHWIVPIIGTGIIGMGNIIIFMSLQL